MRHDLEAGLETAFRTRAHAHLESSGFHDKAQVPIEQAQLGRPQLEVQRAAFTGL